MYQKLLKLSKEWHKDQEEEKEINTSKLPDQDVRIFYSLLAYPHQDDAICYQQPEQLFVDWTERRASCL